MKLFINNDDEFEHTYKNHNENDDEHDDEY